jgi:electron transfer flavoprotein alpha subunit
LDAEVTAVIIGSGVSALAKEIESSGADRVLVLDSPDLAQYSTEHYRDALLPHLREKGKSLILMGATVLGRDLAPALAAPNALDCAYAAECTNLRVESGTVLADRPVFAGKAIVTVSAQQPPLLATLRPNVFDAQATGGGTAVIEAVTAASQSASAKGKVTGSAAASEDTLDVAEADIVVAGGRGLGSPEGFAPVEQLAKALGAAIGASRAVVDLGWRPHSEQVGQTGKVVSPKLYIACGISGAIQHLAGMRTSKVIVAINKDPDAPIFKVADYGIVGDVQEVLPALTKAIQAAK